MASRPHCRRQAGGRGAKLTQIAAKDSVKALQERIFLEKDDGWCSRATLPGDESKPNQKTNCGTATKPGSTGADASKTGQPLTSPAIDR